MAEVIDGRLVLEVAELSVFGKAAVEYVRSGIAVIPLIPGNKEPLTIHGLNDWSRDELQVRFWWTKNQRANIGCVTGQPSGGVFVIDLDVHDPAHNGLEFFKEWQVENGELPETWTQITGSGGKQLFYRASRKVSNANNGKLGIDIRGDGGYAVLPPSVHPCGDAYEWSVSPDDVEIADADDTVFAFIDAIRATASSGGSSSGDGGEHERFSLPEAITESRNNTLHKYCSSLRSRGLSHDEILPLARMANDARCKPPLDEKELLKIVNSACRYEQGDGLHGKDVEEVDASTATYLEDYDPERGGVRPVRNSKTGEVEKMASETLDKIRNVILAHSTFRHGIRFNILDQKLWLLTGCIPGATFEEPHVMNDAERMMLLAYLEREFGVRSRDKFEGAIQSLAAEDGVPFNPIREQLHALPVVRPLDGSTIESGEGPVLVSEDGGMTWTERPRMAGVLFFKYLNCDWSSEYTSVVENLVLRQLVARAMYPGCKADYMIVFVGAQGIGKSTFVSKLALSESFLLTGFSDFGTEDLKRIASKLVVEIPELDGFSNRDMNKIKSVITTTSDNYRESYAKTPSDHPRTAVFFGTTNDSAFLTDSTGNRRFLPVECGKYQPMPDEAVDGDANPALFTDECDRDVRQAWAETIALMDEVGKDRFLRMLVLPRRMAEQAVERQTEHAIEDPVAEMVEEFLDRHASPGALVNVKSVMMDGMGYDAIRYANEKSYMIQRVTAAIERVEGWKKLQGRHRVPGFGVSKAWRYEG